MEIDFGYGVAPTSTDTSATDVNNSQDNVTDLGNIPGGKSATDSPTDLDNQPTPPEPSDAPTDTPPATNDKPSDDDKDDKPLEAGTTLEVGEDTYTVDENGNVLDKDGKIFKEAKDVKEWLAGFEQNNEDNEMSIQNIQELIGIDITDENDKKIEYENTPQGVKAYVDAVIESAKQEHYETAINTLYQKYPILEDVLNYYVANGNSLDGFNEVPDRSTITIDDNNVSQQESIIRTAWKEGNRKGDVESYIAYLKSSGTLLTTAKEELAGLQEADKQYRDELAKQAEEQENQRIAALENYWNGVRDIIKTRKIAGYQIPESIIINRDGQKISVTPEDFYNYIYRVDDKGMSAYAKDLAKETPESRRDDEILRAYLKFVGGNYSNLVDMAINEQQVKKLRLKAKERNRNHVRLTPPNNTPKKENNIDFGYN